MKLIYRFFGSCITALNSRPPKACGKVLGENGGVAILFLTIEIC
tara:strand:- start:285 stop:416 length:132 start_codon:yes stop_codon:yes gene_type:complete